MTIFNYYIDKRLNHKNDKFVDIRLDYPIECEDWEYFKVKLIDFSYLNNEYNISQKLHNNIITLIKTPILKQVVFTNAPNVLSINLSGEFYTDTDVRAYKTGVSVAYDTDNNIQTITGENYKLYYKNEELVDGTDDFNNIFISSIPDTINFNEYDNYLTIETLDSYSAKILREINFSFTHDGSVIPTSVNIDLVVEGSQDNETFTTINYIPDNANIERITFPATTVAGSTNTIYKSNINLNNGIPYKFYRFKINGSLPENSGRTILNQFKLNTLQLSYGEHSYNDVPQTDITHNLTIPDGFYKSNTYIQKINELLTSHNIVLSNETETNKIIFTNNNTTPAYPVSNTDQNGVVKLLVANVNQRHNLGIKNEINLLPRTTPFKSDTNLNLVNFQKLMISTDLSFQNKTHNDLINGNDEYDGVGNILQWIPNDGVPFSYINYTNYDGLEYKINDKYINKIRLNFYNEKRQQIDIDNALIHLQIKKVRSKYY